MGNKSGACIARCALDHIGVSFRLHGREPKSGFDCVGLIADVLEQAGCQLDIPADYTLRGAFEGRVCSFFKRAAFVRVAILEPGDIVLVKPGPRLIHLMVAVSSGFVHAHAGLRRVVFTPTPCPWPILEQWRYAPIRNCGD